MDLNLSDICISTIFLLSILYIFGLIKCYSKLPPGPFGLPILGYLPFINPVKPHETISELVTKYGKIFSMQMGQILCIVLADPEIIRTVFSKSKFQLYYKWCFVLKIVLTCSQWPVVFRIFCPKSICDKSQF